MAALPIRQSSRNTAGKLPQSLEELQARLRCLGLPAEVWTMATIGTLQQRVKVQYRTLAKQCHPDIAHARFTEKEAVEIIVAWMEGTSLHELASQHRCDRRVIWAVVHEEDSAYHDGGHTKGATFRKLTRAYQWCMRLPPHARIPGTIREELARDAARLALPLVTNDVDVALGERHERLDTAGYRIVRNVEGL